MSDSIHEAAEHRSELYDVAVDVLGDPKGQPRVRAFYCKGRGVRVYDPGTAEGWKEQIALALRPFLPALPLTGPVEVEMHCRFARPKSHITSKGFVKSSAPLYYHTKKPDCDNLAKTLDLGKKIGIWVDDCQIVRSVTTKRWCRVGERAGCRLRIREIEPEVILDFDS